MLWCDMCRFFVRAACFNRRLLKTLAVMCSSLPACDAVACDLTVSHLDFVDKLQVHFYENPQTRFKYILKMMQMHLSF